MCHHAGSCSAVSSRHSLPWQEGTCWALSPHSCGALTWGHVYLAFFNSYSESLPSSAIQLGGTSTLSRGSRCPKDGEEHGRHLAARLLPKVSVWHSPRKGKDKLCVPATWWSGQRYQS